MKSTILGLVLLCVCGTSAWASLPQEVNNIRSYDHSITRHPLLKRVRVKTARISLYNGSLKDNLSRIAKRYGWKKVVWLPENDYRWVGQVSFRKKEIYTLFSDILKNYPLQAVFYKGNHVLVITPRNI